MMTTPGTPRPIPVQIIGPDGGPMNPGFVPRPEPRRLRTAVTLTYTLTAASPIHHFAPFDTNRLYMLVQAGGNNVVICTDKSQAQDLANQVAGVPNPNGFLLTAGNTVPLKIEGTQGMYVVANTFPSQLTWIAVHEQPAGR